MKTCIEPVSCGSGHCVTIWIRYFDSGHTFTLKLWGSDEVQVEINYLCKQIWGMHHLQNTILSTTKQAYHDLWNNDSLKMLPNKTTHCSAYVKLCHKNTWRTQCLSASLSELPSDTCPRLLLLWCLSCIWYYRNFSVLYRKPPCCVCLRVFNIVVMMTLQNKEMF